AKKFGTQPQRIELSSESLGECFYDFIEAIDQPSGDGLNSFFVAYAASKKVKVAFSGLGADELFLGYNYMREFERMIRFCGEHSVPEILEKFGRSNFGKKVLYKLGLSFAQWQRGGYEAVYKGYRSLRSPKEVKEMFGKIPPKDFGVKKFFENHDPMNALSMAELAFYASPMLLRDTDAASMFHTLEVRVPFFDSELIKAVLSIPGRFKGNGKKLFVDAARDFIPEEVIGRPKKGFEMPVAPWVFEELWDELGEMEQIGWISKKGVTDSMIPAFDNYEYLPMWSIMVLQQWIKHLNIELSYEKMQTNFIRPSR
ncbi:asparagine synthase, partial [Candidatus Babeliales bacterium]|nr:asparagine synthase [Candidatus Babeliales bacterium]